MSIYSERTKRLTPGEEHNLIVSAQAGDQAAFDRLFRSSLWMVHDALGRMPLQALTGLGSSYGDLAQEGAIALADAILKHDHARPVRLNTFAQWRIFGAATAWLRRRNPMGNASRQSPVLFADLPLDARIGEGPETFLDVTASDDDPEAVAQRAELAAQVRAAIGRMELRPIERAIVRMRFGDDATLQEVATEIGCSREYVRQVQDRLVPRLRRALAQFAEAA